MPSKQQSNREEVLRSIGIFSGCSKRELQSLAKVLKEIDYQTGDEICRQGQSGLGLHVVTEGETEVQVDGQTRRRLGPGAFFGEIALLDGGPRSATVIARTPVSTLSLSTWDFKETLKNHPDLAVKMLEELGRRLRENESSVSH
jgi:CRP/FNR family transcriptional regulator